MTLWFEEHSSDEDMGTECEVSRSWSRAGFLWHTKEEEGRSSFLEKFEEEEVESNENDSFWDDADCGSNTNKFWELKLRISLW